jgi:hypothetical protein
VQPDTETPCSWHNPGQMLQHTVGNASQRMLFQERTPQCVGRCISFMVNQLPCADEHDGHALQRVVSSLRATILATARQKLSTRATIDATAGC